MELKYRFYSGKQVELFFGRVASTPANQARSIQNREDLKALGIDEEDNGRDRLLEIFADGLNAPQIKQKIDDHGTTISRRVQIANGVVEGDIIIRYLYRGGDLSSTPEVTSILPRIYRR